MIIAIDVGNTNIVLGCIENGTILNITRIRTESGATSAEYAIKIKELLDILGIDAKGFEGAVLSSVVPQVVEALQGAVKLVTGLDCLTVGPGMKTGLNIKIDDPSTLGPDLAVGAVAVISCYKTPAIVVDMGTATTITAVDATDSFIGGAILPGLSISYSALSAGTSLLPDISISAPPKAIGTNTVDCMRSGAVFGTAAMIDGMIDLMEKEIGEKCLVIATGGRAPEIIRYCRHDIIHDDDLLLKGLWSIYNRNRKNKRK